MMKRLIPALALSVLFAFPLVAQEVHNVTGYWEVVMFVEDQIEHRGYLELLHAPNGPVSGTVATIGDLIQCNERAWFIRSGH